jgi:hypothetical protein
MATIVADTEVGVGPSACAMTVVVVIAMVDAVGEVDAEVVRASRSGEDLDRGRAAEVEVEEGTLII